MNFTSRSAVECYQTCNRKRFLNYHYDHIGIVPVQASVPLTTGSCIHVGIEHLLKRIRLGVNVLVDKRELEVAVELARNAYRELVGEDGLRGLATDNDYQQKYTYAEQVALTEGLIRAWYYVEAPQIISRFRVVEVEKEINIPLTPDIMFQSRCDSLLQDVQDSSYFAYSLKSAKQWSERQEKSYKRDLQGITEIWSIEEDSRYESDRVTNIINGLENLPCIPVDKKEMIISYLSKKIPLDSKRMMGVKFCYLIKGERRRVNKNDPNSLYVTDSPLLRGYKLVTPSSVNYAHSLFFPNPNNDSGVGRLGKGWERFNAWQDMGVDKWIEMLREGDIQEEAGDPLRKGIVTPIEYFREEEEIVEGIEEIIEQEMRIFNGLRDIDLAPSHTRMLMNCVFPHNRHSCYWPTDCEYLDACWKSEVRKDPIGSGMYCKRIPHHEMERNSLIQIEKK